MMNFSTLFCDFKNLALRTINVLACMLLVAGVSLFAGTPTDNCSESEFTTIYLGEHNGSNYYCSSNNGWTWQQARDYCANNGGHLAIVNNAAENEFLRNGIMADYAWIGYTDEAHEGAFKWVDGSTGSFTNWNAGEPNNSGGAEHYARLLKSNGKWTDRNATFKAEFVMEIPIAGTDLCPNKSFTVQNDGDCPVRLYHWVPAGDIFLTTVEAGASYNLDAAAGSMYRVIDTNQDWNNLLFDEHITVSAECEQTWSVNPQYCDPCTTKELNVVNNGNCPVELYYWIPSGDVFVTTINAGSSFVVSNEAGEMYRVINTNPQWQNLSYDEHITLTEDCNQTWNLNPDYCAPVTCNGAITAIKFNELDDPSLIDLFDGAVLSKCQISGGARLKAIASGDHESLKFHVTGAANFSNTENVVDYDSHEFTAVEGTYTVKTTLYSRDNLGGTLCDEKTITFTIEACNPCNALGGDNDNDGICDDEDCKPNNANYPTTPGTACNDNNASTENDVVLADGCTCEGTEIIVVIDNDNDGVPASQDCDDNDATVPAAVGSACNDGDATTEDDKILADGCTCEGTEIIVVIDNDNDGVPAAEDCDDNDATVPATVGSACNDGDATTEDDKILADGCTCEGTEIIVVIPEIKIDDVTVYEEDGTATLTISIDQPSDSDVTVTYTTSNGDAIDGTDYATTTGTAVIPAGSTSVVVTFPILDDATPENTEVYNVDLTSPVGATIADAQGTITILDADVAVGDVCDASYAVDGDKLIVDGLNDAMNMVRILDTDYNVLYECNSWSTACEETTIFDGLEDGDYIVSIQTNDAAWGTVCQITENFTIGTTVGGACDTNVTDSGSIGNAQTGCGTYDAEAISSVADATGGAGSLEYVWLSSTNGCPVSISQAIADSNSPTLDPGTLTETTWFRRCSRRAGCDAFYPVGESNCIKITVNPGGTPGETCNDNNPNTSNDVIQADGCSCAGEGTPGDDANISINDVVVNEEDGTATLTVSIDQVLGNDLTIVYTTSDDTASGNDYTPATGVITIPAGDLSADVTFPILDDAAAESTEDFQVTLTSPSAGTIIDPVGVVTILDTDVDGPIATDCAAGYTVDGNSITITGLVQPIVMVQILDMKWEVVLSCSSWDVACNETEIFDGLAAGDYMVSIQTTDAAWNQICNITESFTIGGGNGPVDADNDGVIAAEDCDDNDASVPTTPGTSCDDGNAATTNDVILADGCTCEGEGVVVPTDCNVTYEVTNDAITVSDLTDPVVAVKIVDENFNTVYECNAWGTACSTTEVIDMLAPGKYFIQVQSYTADWSVEICSLFEEFTIEGGPITADDNDGDGVPTDEDCDDNDASVPATVGSACDDNDGSTEDDKILADGCTCEGTPIVVASCDVAVTTEGSKIIITGLTAPIVSAKVIDANWEYEFECGTMGTACNDMEMVELAPGTYFVSVQTYDAAWNTICNEWIEVVIEEDETVIPTISIDDVTVNEEDGTASLTISIDAPSDSPITVVYTTGNDTAVNGEDYTPVTATATIPAGSTSVVVDFPIVDNASPEDTEVYVVNLSDATGATIADAQGTITILDTDEIIETSVCDEVDSIRPANDLSSSCHGAADAGRVIWIEGELFAVNGSLNFVEYADGTAQLKGSIVSLDNGATKSVDVSFSGRSNNGNAYTNSCASLDNVNDWYYYDTFTGTIGGDAIVSNPAHGFQVGIGASVKNDNFGASGWYTINGVQGDFNFDLGSAIDCTDNNDNGVIDVCENNDDVDVQVCIEREVSDVTHCENEYNYGFYLRSAEFDKLYNWETATLVERTDGTATLTGSVVNALDSNVGFDVEIELTGRTNNPNDLGTKEHRCDDTVDYSSFYYYSNFTGTISGFGQIEGLSYAIESFGNSFQAGYGASATGAAAQFGASAWWSATQLTAANNGTAFTLNSTTYGPTGGGDINIALTGGYTTCLDNVNPFIANITDTEEATRVSNFTTTTTVDMTSETAKVAEFTLFPNPATELVNIEVSEFAGQDVQVTVFNAIGVQTYNNNITDLNDNVLSINLNQFTNGVYTVMIQVDGKVTSKKFIVSKQ